MNAFPIVLFVELAKVLRFVRSGVSDRGKSV